MLKKKYGANAPPLVCKDLIIHPIQVRCCCVNVSDLAISIHGSFQFTTDTLLQIAQAVEMGAVAVHIITCVVCTLIACVTTLIQFLCSGGKSAIEAAGRLYNNGSRSSGGSAYTAGGGFCARAKRYHHYGTLTQLTPILREAFDDRMRLCIGEQLGSHRRGAP
jgi:hypothetical protein